VEVSAVRFAPPAETEVVFVKELFATGWDFPYNSGANVVNKSTPAVRLLNSHEQ